jgi:hypothetical protein
MMEPGTYHTFFLAFDRPLREKTGQAFDIEIHQTDENRKKVIGGVNLRVELVPEPNK